jgi:hypothetical protein
MIHEASQRVTASDAQSQADRLVVAGRASLVAEATEAALHVTPLPHCGTNVSIMYTFLHVANVDHHSTCVSPLIKACQQTLQRFHGYL